VQMIDVIALDQSMHGGVDGQRSAARPVEAVGEGVHHLVLALLAREHVRKRTRGSIRRTENPLSVRVPRSPPDPVTQSPSMRLPVTGSSGAPLAEVSPPA
jgi:hypothetical protein